MSSNDLSMNLDDWPADPFEILGVARDASERDVKRAYTRRIKRFKPEQHPLHFRRLRDAYEWICQYALPDKRNEAADQIVLETASSLWEPTSPPPPAQNTPLTATPAEQASPRDRWKQLTSEWQRACAGDVAATYARFVAQLANSPEAEVYIRLYWLRFASPEIDPDRTPVDWLAEGIARHGFNGQLAALYIQELRWEPEEASCDRCGRMLAAQQQPGAIIDLLGARWLAYDALAGDTDEKGHWADAIFDDVELVRPRLRLFDEQALTRMLLLAIEHLSWRSSVR
ncbi:MAG TPA: hypothetical protein VGJ26_11620, partial [Pirellulales bacterium]